MKTRPRLERALPACILSFILASCQAPASDDEIRVGLLVPLSSEVGEAGSRAAINGAELAVRQINEAGGIPLGDDRRKIRLLIRDERDSPQLAVNMAMKLISHDKVSALIGGVNSRTAIPLSATAEHERVPLISPTASSPAVTDGKGYVFRVSFTDPEQALAMARYACENLGLRSVAVLYDITSPYNAGLAEAFGGRFRGLGGSVPAFESYINGERDYSAQCLRIKASGAEAVYLPNYESEILRQARQMRGLGFSGRLLGADGWASMDPRDLPQFEGGYFTSGYAIETPNEANGGFVLLYREAYGADPTSTAAHAYDAISILASAIEVRGRADTESIRVGLAAMSGYPGVTGLITYDGGDPVKDVNIMTVEGGRIKYVAKAP